MQCCGPSHCEVELQDYICAALKLLPDFSGKLKPDGNYIKYICASIEAFYECVVQSSCEIAANFSPCSSDIYFEEWIEEYGLPFTCPLDGINADLVLELRRLQLCLQVQLEGGASFNQDLLDQIAEILGIEYDVRVPTRNPDGIDICDIVPMPPNGFPQCNPSGCTFIQAAYINVTCAPTDAHIEVFKCYIEQLTPCHVTICVQDLTPSSEIMPIECTETIDADCLLRSEMQASECTSEIEI